jgi:hypothetical protein
MAQADDRRLPGQVVAQIAARGLDVHLDIVGEDTLDGSVQALARSLALEPRTPIARSRCR